jgi:dCMP deaminase
VTSRPDWDDWALGITRAVSERGDCTRRKVGALILAEDHGPVSFGYNGAEPGGKSCLAGDCPRGRHYSVDRLVFREGERYWEPFCSTCTVPWECPDAVAPGSSYDTGPGACIGVHAEINALLQVSDRSRLQGATMYITDAPCEGCLKIIKNTAISRIVWPGGSYVR